MSETNLHSLEWKPMPQPPDVSGQGFLVGTSGYHYDDWIGCFNPPKLAPGQSSLFANVEPADQDRLVFYQKYFPFVEINNTFYHEPSSRYFQSLERRSRPSTRYAVKVYREISHTKEWNVEAARELMRRHVDAVVPISRSGRFFSFLIQLEDHLSLNPERLDYLLGASSVATAADLDVHIEFRHRSWHCTEALQALKDNGVGICNTEIPPVPHAFPLKAYATSSKGYLRYSGRNLRNWYPKGKQETEADRTAARNARYDYMYSLPEVEERVLGQIALLQKTEAVAVAYNNHYSAQAVMNAIQNMEILYRKLGAKDNL